MKSDEYPKMWVKFPEIILDLNYSHFTITTKEGDVSELKVHRKYSIKECSDLCESFNKLFLL